MIMILSHTRIVKLIRGSRRGRKWRRLTFNDTWIFGSSNPAEYLILELFKDRTILTVARISELLPATITDHQLRTALNILEDMKHIKRNSKRYGREYVLIDRPTKRDMNQWLKDNGYPEGFYL